MTTNHISQPGAALRVSSRGFRRAPAGALQAGQATFQGSLFHKWGAPTEEHNLHPQASLDWATFLSLPLGATLRPDQNKHDKLDVGDR